jgi:hypothetical protein
MIDDRQFPVRYYMTAALPANLSGEGEEPRTTKWPWMRATATTIVKYCKRSRPPIATKPKKRT